MTWWYYDNLEPTPTDSFVEVERVYCLDFDRFSDLDWARLDEVYRALPGELRIASTPMWFGTDEANPPFLWASVEPPGLQVYGVVALDEWRAWDGAFREAFEKSALPLRAHEEE